MNAIIRFLICLYIITCSLYVNGQDNQTHNGLLRLKNLDASQYPRLSLSFDCFLIRDITDSLPLLLEDGGNKIENITLNKEKESGKISIWYVPFAHDSVILNFISKNQALDSTYFNTNMCLWNQEKVIITRPSILESISQKARVYFTPDTYKQAADSLFRDLRREENVCILLFNTFSNEEMETLDTIVSEFSKSGPYVLLATSSPDKITKSDFPEGRKKGVLVPQSINLKGTKRKADITLDSILMPLLNHSYSVEWTTIPDGNLSVEKKIRLSLFDLMVDTCFQIPPSVIEKYFLKQRINQIDTLIAHSQFREALVVLNETIGIIRSLDLEIRYEEIMIGYADHLIINRDTAPFSSFRELEKIYKIPETEAYANSRNSLVREFYKVGCNQGISPFEKLKILEYLQGQFPKDNDVSYDIHKVRADKYISMGEFASALHELDILYRMKNVEAVRMKILHNLDKIITAAYLEKDYNRVSLLCMEFYSYMENDFDLRLKYALSLYSLTEYAKCTGQLEWIILHWEDSPNLEWDHALNMLQTSYVQTSRIAESIKLNRRLYWEGGQELYLNNVIEGHRLLWANIYAELVNLWIINLKSTDILHDSHKSFINIAPDFLSIIVFENQLTNEREVVFSKQRNGTYLENNSIVKIPEDSSASVLRNDPSGTWLIINCEGNNRIAVLIDPKTLTQQEKTIIASIRQDPVNLKRWSELENLEKRLGVKMLVSLSSAAAESSAVPGSTITQFNALWNILKKDNTVRYLAMQARDGSIIQQSNFSGIKEKMKETDWMRSSKTITHYQTELIIGDQNITDISYPLYRGTSWDGVLRIGID